MKSYSFVLENAYKVLHPWNKDDVTGLEHGVGLWRADGVRELYVTVHVSVCVYFVCRCVLHMFVCVWMCVNNSHICG